MTIPRDCSDPERFQQAMAAMDAANAQDPNHIEVNGVKRPSELVYAERVTNWVWRLRPDAPEVLVLAARGQHLCRWMVPRSTYELDRAGYLRWREDLKKFHAAKVGEILHSVGYPAQMMERVRSLNLKANRAKDPDCQTLEDALCLVTLEHQLDALVIKTPAERMVGILQRTWAKMSPQAHREALCLNYTDEAKRLIATALGSP